MKKLKKVLFLLGITLLLSACFKSESTATPTSGKDRGEKEDKDYNIVIPVELYNNDSDEREYKVNHYLENNDGEYTDSVYSETLVGKIGEKTKAEAKEFDGFRVKSFEQEDIKDDGTTSVNIYYEAITYTITLTSDSEEAGIAGSGKFNRYNDTAYLIARPYIGYKFNGWYLNDELLSNDINYSLKVEDDMDIIAKFEMKEEFKNFEFESNLDECIITGLIDKRVKNLVIPEGVTEIFNASFHSNYNIESVIFPETITAINNYAFQYCYNLRTVTFKSTVVVGTSCFSDCFKLLEVYDLGGNNIEQYTNQSRFGSLPKYYKVIHTSLSEESIYEIDQNGFIFTRLDDTNYLVGYTGDNTEVVLPTTAGNYKIYQYAFYINDISVLTIPNSVTAIGDYAFNTGLPHLYEIYNLSSISLTLGDTNNGYVARNAKVVHTDINEERCVFTTSDFIYIKDGENATIIAYTGDKEVETITIPTIGNLKITIDKNLFNKYRALKTVTLSPNVVKIDEFAFSECNNLVEINLDDVETISKRAFYGCISLTEIDLAKCTEIGEDAFFKCSSLKTVFLEECESIGNYAFDSCYSLYHLSFPKVKTIGQGAFSDCYSLCKVALPESLTTINSNAFKGCYRLVEVLNTSSKTITANSTNNGYVGYYAKNIRTTWPSESKLYTRGNLLTYEDGDDVILMYVIECGDELVIPSNVTKISQLAFYGLKHITSLSIPVLDDVLAYYFGVPNSYGTYTSTDLPNKLEKVYLTGNIVNIPAKAFYDRESIKEINIPASVSIIREYAFSGLNLDNVYYDGSIEKWTEISFADSTSNPIMCSNMAYLKDDNGSITYGGKTYSSITNVSISEGVTSIGDYQFAGLPFETISIPSTVTSIGKGAFSECKNLKEVELPSGITEINDELFYNCKKLKKVIIPNTVTTIGDSAFAGTGLNEIILGDNITYVDYFAFADCVSLIKATITNVDFLASGLFQGCINLQKVYLNNDITEFEANVFNNCKSLTSITLPSSLEIVGYQAFAYSNIKYLTLPASVTTIGAKAFYKCTNLRELDLGNTSITSFTDEYGDSIISGCNKLTNIVIPDTVTSFSTYFVHDIPKFGYAGGLYFGTKSYPYKYFYRPSSTEITTFDTFHPDCTYIWDDAFVGCVNIKSLTIPNTITYYDSLFDYRTLSIESITLPKIPFKLRDLFGDSVPDRLKSVTLTTGAEIKTEAFYHCIYLETIVLSNDLTSIGADAFDGCTSLKSIIIPNSVETINSYAFGSCSGLTHLEFLGSVSDWENITKGSYIFSGAKLNGEDVTTIKCIDGNANI